MWLGRYVIGRCVIVNNSHTTESDRIQDAILTSDADTQVDVTENIPKEGKHYSRHAFDL